MHLLICIINILLCALQDGCLSMKWYTPWPSEFCITGLSEIPQTPLQTCEKANEGRHVEGFEYQQPKLHK